MSDMDTQPKRLLPPRVARFVAGFAGDAKSAAIRAGYSPRTAKSQASRLMKRPDVIAALRERRQQLRQRESRSLERVELNTERTLGTIAALAYFDPRDMVHSDGAVRSMHEMPLTARMAIQGIEIIETFEGNGEDRRKVVRTKVRLANRIQALDMTARVLGLYAKDNDQHRDVHKMSDDELLSRLLTILGTCGQNDPPAE